MIHPRVKICGITRAEDARTAVDAGAAFLGFVFASGSPRRVDPAGARRIIEGVKERNERVRCVGVFVDESPDDVNRVAGAAGLDLVQLHGREPATDLDRIAMPVIRAVRVADSRPDLTGWEEAAWILFDAYAADRDGGTGRTFDWSLVAGVPRTRPFFLSGGLNASNIADAIATVQPDAVDVSSGVEDAPGIKSPAKIHALFEALSNPRPRPRGPENPRTRS